MPDTVVRTWLILRYAEHGYVGLRNVMNNDLYPLAFRRGAARLGLYLASS